MWIFLQTNQEHSFSNEVENQWIISSMKEALWRYNPIENAL